jgi:hypothetical protein
MLCMYEAQGGRRQGEGREKARRGEGGKVNISTITISVSNNIPQIDLQIQHNPHLIHFQKLTS